MKKFLAILMILCLVVPVFAQRSARQKTTTTTAPSSKAPIPVAPATSYSVTVLNMSEGIDTLYVDSTPYRGITATVTPGTHTFMVVFANNTYKTWQQTINVTRSMTLSAEKIAQAVVPTPAPAPAPTPVTPSNGNFVASKKFVGYGYDYFSEFAMESKKKDIVLDFDAMNRDGILDTGKQNQAKVYSIYGSTAEEYSKSFNVDAGVEGSYGGFTGSLSTQFGEATATTKTKAFTTIQGMFYQYKEKVKNSSIRANTLKKYLVSNAKSDINAVRNQADAYRIFNDYGTHVIVGAYQGGRIDYNATTTSSSISSAKDFAMAVEAGYEGAVAKASAKYSNSINSATRSAAESAQKDLNTYGGDSQYSMEIFNDNNYRSWSEGLEDEDTWTLASFPRQDEGQALFPIWELADNATAKNQIQAAFKTWGDEHRFVAKNVVEPLYIVDLKIVNAKNDLPPEIFEDEGKTWYRLGTDFNYDTYKQNKKQCLYYRLGTKDEGAISEIKVWGKESKDPGVAEGYTNLGDLNSTGRGGWYVMLGYKRDPHASSFISGLKQNVNSCRDTWKEDYYSQKVGAENDWEPLRNQLDISTVMNFNRGNDGNIKKSRKSADIYLYFTRDTIMP